MKSRPPLYPVIWITLAWLGGCAVLLIALIRWERVSLDRQPAKISRRAAVFGCTLLTINRIAKEEI